MSWAGYSKRPKVEPKRPPRADFSFTAAAEAVWSLRLKPKAVAEDAGYVINVLVANYHDVRAGRPVRSTVSEGNFPEAAKALVDAGLLIRSAGGALTLNRDAIQERARAYREAQYRAAMRRWRKAAEVRP